MLMLGVSYSGVLGGIGGGGSSSDSGKETSRISSILTGSSPLKLKASKQFRIEGESTFYLVID